ncbi:MAG: Maf family nucleotide pyrophosphatase [Bacteroidota bacterium]|nr:Maf family nucleotide pyrophosphatase [Bacteroidota bacterium]MDX5504652.1 Maf family nucleotide pyrophosphatase [Bacteroidota bacterium]
MIFNPSPFRLVLGSGSPRRKQLLLEIGLHFAVRTSDADESAPLHLSGTETAVWVSEAKAKALLPDLQDNEILITADTEVWKGEERFGKPADEAEAMDMLIRLSGTKHQVIGGVTLTHRGNMRSFSSVTEVFFKPLSRDVIRHYVENYRPLDKAGAYGIQEWIGLIGINRIEGSYNNVVGLPTAELMEHLIAFRNEIGDGQE